MMRSYMVVLVAVALAVPATGAAQDPAAVADGARVWAGQCTRCHNARPSTERTDAQWATIVAHMRARGNLTRTQTRLITAFMQATNSPEITAARATTPAPVSPSPDRGGAEVERTDDTATVVLSPEEWRLSLALYLRSLVPPER